MFSSLFLKRKSSTGIFIPKGNSFGEFTKKINNMSLNGICEHMGYNAGQVYIYSGCQHENTDIQQVAFEIFTENIIFVKTKDNVVTLEKRQVDYFLKDFKLFEAFDSIRAEEILEEGINNRWLTADFLARVLNVKNFGTDGIFYVQQIGYYLYFNNGFLTAFTPSDGLNKWAKNWKRISPDLIERHEILAKHYWGNQTRKISNEINMQAEAYNNLPNLLLNEFIHLHTTEFDTVNYFMLQVCHYGKRISMTEFEEINHGRYCQIHNSTDNIKEYGLDGFFYQFLSDGTLSVVERI